MRINPRLAELETEAKAAGRVRERFWAMWDRMIPDIEQCAGFTNENWRIISRRLWLAWLCGDADLVDFGGVTCRSDAERWWKDDEAGAQVRQQALLDLVEVST